MRVAALHLWAQTKHRWACATGQRARLDFTAATANATWEPWCDAGFPYRRLIWAASWLTHWALWPLRRTVGV
jgi:hypothetical protein